MISSTAEKGIASTTIADVVGRARVSSSSFLQAVREQRSVLDRGDRRRHRGDRLQHHLGHKARPPNLSLHEQLSAVTEKYLETCSSEPEFVRAWVVDLPVAGPAGVAKRNEYCGTARRCIARRLLVQVFQKPRGVKCFSRRSAVATSCSTARWLTGSNSYMNLHARDHVLTLNGYWISRPTLRSPVLTSQG